jgi:hypothetical protein
MVVAHTVARVWLMSARLWLLITVRRRKVPGIPDMGGHLMHGICANLGCIGLPYTFRCLKHSSCLQDAWTLYPNVVKRSMSIRVP